MINGMKKNTTRRWGGVKKDISQRLMSGMLVLMAGCAVRPCEQANKAAEAQRPRLTKILCNFGTTMENTPFVFKGNLYIAFNVRNDSPDRKGDYTSDENMHLYIADLNTGKEVAHFGAGHSFVSAYVEGETLHIFASEGSNNDWFHNIYHFTTTDLKTWQRSLAIPREPKEHLFNTSVTKDEQGYVMTYETNETITFCFKFARSKDLRHWEKIPGLLFTGVGEERAECPVIRYIAPYYYVIYLHLQKRPDGQNDHISYLARSRDLIEWELSPFNPILKAGPGEGVNNSDVDLFEYEGRTWLYYATGDQKSWGSVRTAMYDGPMKDFFEHSFPAGVATIRCRADGKK
jgi:hypothetical protein